MTRRRWWWVGILMIAGALGGCSGGDHNDAPSTVQALDVVVGDSIRVDGELFNTADEDSHPVLIQESLTLVVTLSHRLDADFDIQIFDADTGRPILDCGINVVPEVCTVPFVVRSGDIAVDVVVTSVFGAGPYTLTLDAR